MYSPGEESFLNPLAKEQTMIKKIVRYFATTMTRNRNTLGATAIEYGLIAALLSVAIIAVVSLSTGRSGVLCKAFGLCF